MWSKVRGRRQICVFFFKQKTAYEMRISDWSSDVCSSDRLARLNRKTFGQRPRADARRVEGLDDLEDGLHHCGTRVQPIGDILHRVRQIAGFVDKIDQMGCNQQVSALESGSGLGGQMIVERDRGCDRRLVILVPAEPGNRSAVQIQSAVQSVDRKSTRLNSSH